MSQWQREVMFTLALILSALFALSGVAFARSYSARGQAATQTCSRFDGATAYLDATGIILDMRPAAEGAPASMKPAFASYEQAYRDRNYGEMIGSIRALNALCIPVRGPRSIGARF